MARNARIGNRGSLRRTTITPLSSGMRPQASSSLPLLTRMKSFKRANFLRAFGFARLPKNSAICRRAGEMLSAQHQPRLALAAVEKALLADPMDQPAQRLKLEVQNATPEH